MFQPPTASADPKQSKMSGESQDSKMSKMSQMSRVLPAKTSDQLAKYVCLFSSGALWVAPAFHSNPSSRFQRALTARILPRPAAPGGHDQSAPPQRGIPDPFFGGSQGREVFHTVDDVQGCAGEGRN